MDQLRVRADAIPQKRFWKRVQTILLAQQGWTAIPIAHSRSGSIHAVKNWVAPYHRGGIAAFRERPRPGRPRRLDPEHYPRLEQRRDAPARPEDGVCTRRAAEVRRILDREFGVRRGRQAVSDRLPRRGDRDRMPRPHPAEANPAVPEFFKESVVAPIDAIAADPPATDVRVSFQDEARFGTPGTITRVGARPGSRPRAVRQNGRAWLDVLMAVGASTGAAAALIRPDLSTVVVNWFLAQVAREWPAGVPAVLIWDGAGFHTGGDLVVPGTVSLIPLPPSSPELNPVENLGHYRRSHHGSNRAYEGYKDWEEEAVRSVRAVCQDVEKLKTICNAEYVNQRA